MPVCSSLDIPNNRDGGEISRANLSHSLRAGSANMCQVLCVPKICLKFSKFPLLQGKQRLNQLTISFARRKQMLLLLLLLRGGEWG
jgi:hypothetical protein